MNGMAPIHIFPLLEIAVYPMSEDQHYVTKQSEMDLMELGLIEKRHNPSKRAMGYSEYHITEKGRVYFDALTDVPLPTQTWTVIL